jgi:hypothetical protein
VSMSWSDGALTRAAIEASADGPCRVAAEGLTAVLLDDRSVPVTRAADGSLEFQASAGSNYRLVFEG